MCSAKTFLCDKKDCSGCRACEQSCPVKAITMQIDEEGFFYPQIDEKVCIKCGNCEKACPVSSARKQGKPQAVYAAVHRDQKTLLDSSSGGVFTALATHFLLQGGAVVGCAFDEDFRATQVIIRDKALLPPLRGSKYVQSDTGSTYPRVRELLEQGVSVLYTGSPCQIAGLCSFLGKEYPNLLTADFICHGVPSSEMFLSHIKWLEEKKRSNLWQYRFRNKFAKSKNGRQQHSFLYSYSYLNKSRVEVGSASLDPYFFAFLQGESYRECCYSCSYATENRVADITFGDYWEIEQFHPELQNESGVSVLLLNTDKGLSYQGVLEKEMHLISSKLDWVKQINVNLNRPAARPMLRDNIYKQVNNNGYSGWADKYCGTIKWKLRYCYGKLPGKVKRFLRRLRN